MRELEAHKHNSPLNSGGNSHPQRFAHTVIIHILKELHAIMILTTHDLVSIFPMIRKTRTPWDVGGYWVVPTGYTPAYENSFVGLYHTLDMYYFVCLLEGNHTLKYCKLVFIISASCLLELIGRSYHTQVLREKLFFTFLTISIQHGLSWTNQLHCFLKCIVL